jgi:hypothetical protein
MAQETLFQLKFQAKQLERQAQREQKTADKERRLAKQFLQKGQRNFALLHAQNCTRNEKLATFLLENASKVSAMAVDVQMAQVTAQSTKALAAATKEMDKHLTNMNLQKIAEMAYKYDQLRGKTESVQQLVAPTDDVVQMGSASLLDDLERELEAETMGGALEIPVADIPVAVAAPEAGLA